MPRLLLIALVTTCFAACAHQPRTTIAPAAAAAPAPAAAAATRDEATAAAISKVLASDHRSSENTARDQSRHPVETLLFFGIKPQMTVVEVWPGSAGYYTEILAPLLRGGKMYTALMPPEPGNDYLLRVTRQFEQKLASLPEVYAGVTVTRLGAGVFDIAPPASADMVVTFRALHSWMDIGIAAAVLAEIHRALKPGGVLGVEDNRADPARPVDIRARNGYVNEDYAIGLIEAAGFELLERSAINSNPRDIKDHEQGAWALPPIYRAGNRDRAKYEAIGEPDQFTLKFRKR